MDFLVSDYCSAASLRKPSNSGEKDKLRKRRFLKQLKRGCGVQFGIEL